MFALISLGFTLSLDNFRSSLVLGGLKPSFAQSVKTSAIFGLWDGVAPAVGILIGHFLSDKVDSTSETIAMIGLGAYGVFLIARAVISPERADPELKWARRGLPLPLSVDNVAAGTALGLAGYSPWLAPDPVRGDHVCGVDRRAPDRPHSRALLRLHPPDQHRPVDRDRVSPLIAVMMALGVTLPLSGD